MEISVTFGQIVINGVQYSEDVIVSSDGTITKRLKEISKPLKAKYGHTPLTKKEVEETVKRFRIIDTLIIGTGHYGALPIEKDTLDFLEQRGIKYIIKKTKDAIDEFLKISRSRNKGVIAIFHITC